VTLLCKEFTHKGELGQCRKDLHVRGRFVVNALVRFVSRIGKVKRKRIVNMPW
jgi:hypothetical protein